MLNLGCGTKTSENFVNIDWSPALLVSQSALLRTFATIFLDEQRRDRLRELKGNVLVHNLKNGIPFQTGTVDVVYHSHILEHLNREHVSGFLDEIVRVLKPGGLHRICVPDLEALVRRYLRNLEVASASDMDADHDAYIEAFLEQCVRREPYGTRHQPRVRRALENFLFGDARKRGETHQWMYDRVNLKTRLRDAGFSEIRSVAWNESSIPLWRESDLESGAEGQEYKPHSLYMECRKPTAPGA